VAESKQQVAKKAKLRLPKAPAGKPKALDFDQLTKISEKD